MNRWNISIQIICQLCGCFFVNKIFFLSFTGVWFGSERDHHLTLLVDEIFQGGEVETKELGNKWKWIFSLFPLLGEEKSPKIVGFSKMDMESWEIVRRYFQGTQGTYFSQFIGFPDLHFSVFWDGWIFGEFQIWGSWCRFFAGWIWGPQIFGVAIVVQRLVRHWNATWEMQQHHSISPKHCKLHLFLHQKKWTKKNPRWNSHGGFQMVDWESDVLRMIPWQNHDFQLGLGHRIQKYGGAFASFMSWNKSMWCSIRQFMSESSGTKWNKGPNEHLLAQN